MDTVPRRAELGAFLTAKRARLQPSDVGLAAGRRRRVPGLRREEVAELAGISAAWYTLFERGDPRITVSLRVVDRISAALRLDERERARLAVLALPGLDLTARAFRETAAVDALRPVSEFIHVTRDASPYEIVEAAIAFVNATVDLPVGNIVIQSLADGRVEVAHGTRAYAQTAGTRLDDSGMLRLRDIAYDGSLDVVEDIDALTPFYRRLLEPYAVHAYCALPIDIGRDYPIFITAAAHAPTRITAAQRAALRLAGDFAGSLITRARPDCALLDPW